MERRPDLTVAAPAGLPLGAASDVVEETVALGGQTVRMLRPRDGDAVLDELLAEDDPEEERLPFWTQLWPSGTALARTVAGRPLAGRRVLELGCGLGLVSVAAVDQPERLLAEAPWDLVLAADVLYEQRNVPVLLWLLPRLVGPAGEAWLADPGRTGLETFLTGADATGWRRDQLPGDGDLVTVHRLRRTT